MQLLSDNEWTRLLKSVGNKIESFRGPFRLCQCIPPWDVKSDSQKWNGNIYKVLPILYPTSFFFLRFSFFIFLSPCPLDPVLHPFPHLHSFSPTLISLFTICSSWNRLEWWKERKSQTKPSSKTGNSREWWMVIGAKPEDQWRVFTLRLLTQQAIRLQQSW